jgi:hypothetical protein
MKTLNRYITNQRVYVKEKMKQPLTGFTNQKGGQATWDDIAVTFNNSKGSKSNFLFNNQNQPHANKFSTFTQGDRLDAETHNLIFAYTLDILKENTTVDVKKGKVTSAKKFLTALNENVASASLNEIQDTIGSMVYTNNLMPFFNWLQQHRMLAAGCIPSIKKRGTSFRFKSGDDALDAEQHRLPDENALLALGAIFTDVIIPYSNKDDKSDISSWQEQTHAVQHQRDSFT